MSSILLDSIVGIVILLSVIIAFFRGFVREMLTIVNLVGAAAGAYFLADPLKPHFDKWLKVPVDDDAKVDLIWGVIPPEIMSAFLSYACPFFGVFLILTLAGLYIPGTVKALGLGPADRTLGVAFGALRGALLVFIVYLPFAYFMVPNEYPKWAKNSISVGYLEKAYKEANEYFNARKKDENGEEMIDPDSIAGKLKAQADKMTKEKAELQRELEEEVRNGNLTREEVDQYRNGGSQ